MEQTVGTSKKDDVFKGKFLVLTVYAILDVEKNGRELKRATSLRNRIQNFFNMDEDEVDNQNEKNNRRSLNAVSFNNRRNLGAVTYNLEGKYFTLKLKNNCLSTPDIWRPLQIISSGIQQKSVSLPTRLLA